MGLSEPRGKQRLVGSSATRNTAWLNDASLPGQRMLSAMGWAPGAGLGSNLQGMSSNLSLGIKLDNKGIGAHRHEKEAREQGKADAWVGAGGDLGSLFDRLNAANNAEHAGSEEPAAKRVRTEEETVTITPPQRPVSRLAYVLTNRASCAFSRSKAERIF